MFSPGTFRGRKYCRLSVWVDVEEGEPVDYIEGEEEAGEDDQEHEVHPGRPHLVIYLNMPQSVSF